MTNSNSNSEKKEKQKIFLTRIHHKVNDVLCDEDDYLMMMMNVEMNQVKLINEINKDKVQNETQGSCELI